MVINLPSPAYLGVAMRQNAPYGSPTLCAFFVSRFGVSPFSLIKINSTSQGCGYAGKLTITRHEAN